MCVLLIIEDMLFRLTVLCITTKYHLNHHHPSLALYLLVFFSLKLRTASSFSSWVIRWSLGKSQPLIISFLVKWMHKDEQAALKWKCSHGYSTMKLTSQPISQPCLSVTAGVGWASPLRRSLPWATLARIQEPQLSPCVTAINDANLFLYLEIFRPSLAELWTLLWSGRDTEGSAH